MKKHIRDPRSHTSKPVALCGGWQGRGRLLLTEEQASEADHRDLCVKCQRTSDSKAMQRYRRRQLELAAVKGA